MGKKEDIIAALRFVGWISKYQNPLCVITAEICVETEKVIVYLNPTPELKHVWHYKTIEQVGFADMFDIEDMAWNYAMRYCRNLLREMLIPAHMATMPTGE